VQPAEHLLCKCEALSSNLSPTTNKREKKRKRESEKEKKRERE
jgi:hypothetical protein